MSIWCSIVFYLFNAYVQPSSPTRPQRSLLRMLSRQLSPPSVASTMTTRHRSSTLLAKTVPPPSSASSRSRTMRPTSGTRPLLTLTPARSSLSLTLWPRLSYVVYDPSHFLSTEFATFLNSTALSLSLAKTLKMASPTLPTLRILQLRPWAGTTTVLPLTRPPRTSLWVS